MYFLTVCRAYIHMRFAELYLTDNTVNLSQSSLIIFSYTNVTAIDIEVIDWQLCAPAYLKLRSSVTALGPHQVEN